MGAIPPPLLAWPSMRPYTARGCA